ncbi:MAG TPA: trifunctional transcriptional activator/DNA repair protein Ada/methylated-DNA--[protein]-cysteine S-methyltransferase [Vicinamibacterales bacterium]
MHSLPPFAELYRALITRDPSYEGVAYVCVRTTGIFCRTTCRARKPLAANVEFVATIQEALHRGYRPCRVCSPLERPSDPAWVAALIERVRTHPDRRITDSDVRAIGIDPAQARRYFKSHYGMSFHAYQRAWRLGRAMKGLREGSDTLSTALDAGFDSESGFREAFARVFGDAPGRSRARPLLTARWLETPLGPMLAIASETGLVLLEFVDRRALETELRDLRKQFATAIVPGDSVLLDRTASQLDEYFAGTRKDFDVPLDPRGSAFELKVWRELRTIPHGRTRSYAEIAAAVGGTSPRAIGRANGRNRIAIVIPCHRVIRADGALCGYGGGIWRKEWLLSHERSSQSTTVTDGLNLTEFGELTQRAPESGDDEGLRRRPTAGVVAGE